ncbi:IS5 family transposase [Thiococcus pfennigii]|uniref:IS5 family transposase n=1 Tax=Thiococcus pfennigii TaxID=1057 RepID=UPI001F5B81EB|nr:IS5 family transposase [Thiococcus pfennigii]
MMTDDIQEKNGYPSDLTDEEWSILLPIIRELEAGTRGRPRKVDLRRVVDALFYLNKTGCPWRYLPKDFPSYKVVNYYYNKWRANGTWEKINTALRQRLREQCGRRPDPSAAIIDSQSFKGTPESAEESGFDGGKLVKGRKRHIVVDTIGCVISVDVHAANIFDGKAAPKLLEKLFLILSTIQIIWADMAYGGQALFDWVLARFHCVIDVVRKQAEASGFHVLPRRWVVERTFAWLTRSRRLSKDYERTTSSSESQVYLASSRLLLRQITGNQIPYKMANTSESY